MGIARTVRIGLMLALGSLLIACQPLPQTSQPIEAPDIVGRLRVFGPNVTVNSRPAIDGSVLRRTDFIATGAGSRARIMFNPGGLVDLEEDTDPIFELDWLSATKCLITFVVHLGSVGGDTAPCEQQVTDPSGNQILAGSRYVLTVAGESSVLTLLRGRARVTGARRVTVAAGEQVVMGRDFISEPRRLSDRELQFMTDWLDSFNFTGVRKPVPLVTVPGIVDLDLKQAERRLASARLALGQVRERPSRIAPPGILLVQRPAAGARVPPGTAVYVELAAAPPSGVRVPALRGLTLPDVERRLAAAKLRLGSVGQRETSAPAGTVLEQHPDPGTMVSPGSSVDVVLARPRQPPARTPVLPVRPAPPMPQEKLCTVPRIEGLNIEVAREVLRSRGFTGRVRSRAGTQPDKVFNQEPKPGERIPCGQPILYDLGTIL